MSDVTNLNRVRRSSSVYEGGDFDKDATTQFREALIEDDVDEALRLLQRENADPNYSCQEPMSVGNKFLFSHSPLCVAALQNNTRLVSALLDAKASTESTYSLNIGTEHMLHVFTAAVPAVSNNNLEMLGDLVSSGLNIHQMCTQSHATLLYQAAYSDTWEIAEYLVEAGVDVEAPAIYLDDNTRSHTPLHIAALLGNHRTVELLLDRKANHEVSDGYATPLDDALRGGYSKTVEHLVGAGSVTKAMWTPASPVTILSVAKGLHRHPATLSGASLKDMAPYFDSSSQSNQSVLRFILPSLFEKKSTQCLRYWSHGLTRRVELSAFHLRIGMCWRMMDYKAVGVAEGPHEQIMQTKFKEKKSIEEDDDDSVLLDFVEHLLPQKESFRTQMVPAGIYRSRVPDIHDDFRVLLAIVECQGHETFKSYACQSILKFWWTKENMPVRTLFLRIWQFLYVAVYGAVLMIIRYCVETENQNLDSADIWWNLATGLVAVLVLFCTFDIVQEICQCIGYHHAGFFWHYVTDWWNAVEFLTVAFSVATLLDLARICANQEIEPFSRRVLAVMVCWRWVNMTKYYVTGTALGPVVLPILKAAGDIGGFFFVVGISLMAFISGYLALVPDYPLYVIFVSAFRTAIFGDGALTDVEEEGAVDEMTSDDTKFREEVMTFPVENIFMSLVAFALGVVLMNIFIAVLSINYERQYKLAWTSFMRARAGATADTAAFALGLRIIKHSLWGGAPDSSQHEVGSGGDHGPTYLWVACDANLMDDDESRNPCVPKSSA